MRPTHSILYSLLLLGFVLMGFPIHSQAQSIDSTASPLFQELGTFRFFTTDRLNQLYLVTEKDEVIKYTAEGQVQFDYPNTTLGILGAIDVADPFSPMLFYPDQQLIVQLDRTFGERSRLDLRTTPIQNATAIARSHNNQIWVYDDYAYQLILLSPTGTIQVQSDDLRLTEQVNEAATQVVRWGEQVLVVFPEKGVAVFSNVAQLLDWWPLPGIEQLLIRQDQPLFLLDGQYCTYQAQSKTVIPFPQLTNPTIQQLDIRQDRVYQLKEEGLFIFQLSGTQE